MKSQILRWLILGYPRFVTKRTLVKLKDVRQGQVHLIIYHLKFWLVAMISHAISGRLDAYCIFSYAVILHFTGKTIKKSSEAYKEASMTSTVKNGRKSQPKQRTLLVSSLLGQRGGWQRKRHLDISGLNFIKVVRKSNQNTWRRETWLHSKSLWKVKNSSKQL